ncbi:cytochrome b/b6 domain-containing protein [Minwuia thermotolerans]|uniref:Cytochrome B n=1 Tax=Minwuia thermotolerans TaxID=2056226 RepID=A0A2M9G6V5_9PROT|nr:cytochrome b/b6 domain-containing protein [Minwuia thermotolerans]PJK31434.1 cytochrome B [Minwuia thermotolerans]
MATEAGNRPVRIWDPLVRLTHWGVAIAVLLNGLVIDEHALAHIWIGYVALGLLALRVMWGFVGTAPARFSAFPPSLSAALGHIGDLMTGRHRRHDSHNPLGALMVYALWGSLALVSVTGVMMESSPFPAASDARVEQYETREEDEHDDEGEEILEEVHEVFANLLLLLAALHVGGVILESRLSGVNLARQMVTGLRETPRSRRE